MRGVYIYKPLIIDYQNKEQLHNKNIEPVETLHQTDSTEKPAKECLVLRTAFVLRLMKVNTPSKKGVLTVVPLMGVALGISLTLALGFRFVVNPYFEKQRRRQSNEYAESLWRMKNPEKNECE
ncbi:hypothetical protein Bhyg_04427 [Pseudolycoriella hygida]|uniref:Uncharacterized protein n=1 Tax=Pseudolycoriella hygida TaxID=35572 RepID=A0A9Q0S9K9_9DIPT|nr:hypothetical protein Bhyg_04427 [Pseudolycoriella hygida]